MNSLPASSFKLLSGKGTISRHLMTSNMLVSDQLLGLQSFFRVLTQISPDGETLGWKILVKKYPMHGYKTIEYLWEVFEGIPSQLLFCT